MTSTIVLYCIFIFIFTFVNDVFLDTCELNLDVHERMAAAFLLACIWPLVSFVAFFAIIVWVWIQLCVGISKLIIRLVRKFKK